MCITAFPMLARIIHFKKLTGTTMGTVAQPGERRIVTSVDHGHPPEPSSVVKHEALTSVQGPARSQMRTRSGRPETERSILGQAQAPRHPQMNHEFLVPLPPIGLQSDEQILSAPTDLRHRAAGV